MDNHLKNLKNQYKNDIPTRFTDKNKQAVLQKIQKTKQIKRSKKKKLLPIVVTAISVAAVVFISLIFINKPFEQNIANKSAENTPKNSRTMDGKNLDSGDAAMSSFSNNAESLETITPAKDDMIIDWVGENMDRGNHEYKSSVHGDLVIRESGLSFQRGEVIYFDTPELDPSNEDIEVNDEQISRIVGLPGETIEIIQGQIYINDQPLDTFYGQATIKGMAEEAYFNHTKQNQSDEDEIKAYFSIDMEPIEIDGDSVFVLGDQWLKSIDSKDFGPLSTENIIGEVIGYKK